MPEIPNPIKKPLVKKYDEVGNEPKPTVEETIVVEKPVVEVKEKPPVVEKPVVPSRPKRYRCKVRCWVSSKCQMFEPGDYATFEPGEFVPEHFELSE